MFAHFLMRRTTVISFALSALVATTAAAQTTAEHHPKPHHSTVRHPRPQHPPPPSSPEAQEHKRTMQEERSLHSRNSLSSNEGRASLSAERRANSEHKAEGSHQVRSHRNNPARTRTSRKHHGTGKQSSAQSRLELERRREAEMHARYEAGYRAGFAAGLAAHRSEVSSTQTEPAEVQPEAHRLAAHSPVPGAPAAAAPHVADATVTSTTPVSADPAARSAIAHHPSRPEAASLELVPGAHAIPVTLQASKLMLHEPVPAPLRGTLASLERQNRRLDEEGLQRVEDEGDLQSRIARKLLVPLPASSGLLVNPDLSELRRYCRPWTAEFLGDLARMHDAVFHRPLRVDSAVRTVDYQRRLIAINANAAPAEGDIASPHETGAAVDIAKRGMTWREIGWMRRYLTTLQNQGLVDVEEEFYQSCFHITVYDTYGRMRRSPLRTAGTPGGDGTERTSDAAGGAEGMPGQ